MAGKNGEPIIRKVKNTSVAVSEDASIYKKKYYKVVLHSIDRNRETRESFSIKMSIRLRTPMPRVKQLLGTMPCTIKSGLSVSQANKLFAVMEELGAKATIEDYYLTPGKTVACRPAVAGLATRSTQIGSASSFNCPSCGWEIEAGSDHCPLCLEIFRRAPKRAAGAAADEGREAPDETARHRPQAPPPEKLPHGCIVIQRRWIVLAAALVILVLAVILLK